MDLDQLETGLTIFNNIKDVNTDKVITFNNFNKLESFLYKLYKKPSFKPKNNEDIKHKNAAKLLSPAIYINKTRRKNDNVLYWYRLASIDVDDIQISPGKDLKEYLNSFINYYYICYSTASSRKERPKFRLIFPLSDVVYKKDIRNFWYALNIELNYISDKQCKDFSRMFYTPGQYENAYNFFFINKSENTINPYKLIEKYPNNEIKQESAFADKQNIQQALANYKKNKLYDNTNKNITWTSYHDCPFINKRKIVEYQSITETGWYMKLYEIAVSIAGNAIRKYNYPITAKEIAFLLKSIDNDNGMWYNNRPLEKESQRAIDYILCKQ